MPLAKQRKRHGNWARVPNVEREGNAVAIGGLRADCLLLVQMRRAQATQPSQMSGSTESGANRWQNLH